MKNLILLIGSLLMTLTMYGQCYESMLKKGDALKAQGKYSQAIECYQDAKGCKSTNEGVLDARISACKKAMTSQRNTTNCGTVTDADGNEYKTVLLGSQCWMAENLRTTHYSDGTSIPQGSSESSTTGYWYYPDGNSGNKRTYGLLYNWAAVMNGSSSSERNPSGVQGICPTGWHVPSDAEWTQLENYVSSQSKYRCGGDAKNIAKALASTKGWHGSSSTCAVGKNRSTNNATGFSAVPAGYYGYSYILFGCHAGFWSATQDNSNNAYDRALTYDYTLVYRDNSLKDLGFSVRCLRD